MDISSLFNMTDRDWLIRAQYYADKMSTCQKVKVGSIIIPSSKADTNYTVVGVNDSLPFEHCEVKGCYRKEKYGNDSKAHRCAGDCRAIHSEVNAIATCAQTGLSTKGATIYVTRYPCEECAKAIVKAGIKRVVYGRTQEITPLTSEIFWAYGVEVVHIPDIEELNDTDAEVPVSESKKEAELAGMAMQEIANKFSEVRAITDTLHEGDIDNPANQSTLCDIRKKYGSRAQICVCIEELNELACVLAKFLRYEDPDEGVKELYDKVLDEYTDVSIILEHVKAIFDLGLLDRSERVIKKINRIKRWIDSEDKTMGVTLTDRKL